MSEHAVGQLLDGVVRRYAGARFGEATMKLVILKQPGDLVGEVGGVPGSKVKAARLTVGLDGREPPHRAQIVGLFD